MFIQLIDRAAAAAQAVLTTPGLPPQAQPLRDHAATFPKTIGPVLRTTGTQIMGVASTTQQTVGALKPLVDSWKNGTAGVQPRVLADLQQLLGQFNGLLQSDQNAFTSMSRYRDQVLADQRTVAAMINDFNSRLSALRSQLNEKISDMHKQQDRLRILRMIPFPLPWAVAEIASLISSSKTLEQQVSDCQRDIASLDGQMHSVGQASSAASGFSGQLGVLESSLQNLLNSVSITQGQLTQMIGSLQSGQQGTSAAVVEAYLLTLNGQAQNLAQYLNS